jgi:hypothetical protein
VPACACTVCGSAGATPTTDVKMAANNSQLRM